MVDLYPQFCEEAAKKWDIARLLSKLAETKKTLKPRTTELSPHEKECLCLLLCGNSTKAIAEKTNSKNVGKLLSEGLYQYITVLTGKKIEDWRDVIIHLDAEGFRKSLGERSEIKIILNLNINELPDSKLQEVLEKLQEIAGDSSMEIQRVDLGSIVLTLIGTTSGCERLENLFRLGQLKEVAGIPVSSVYLIVKPRLFNRLTQWFQNVFEEGWQQPNLILDPIFVRSLEQDRNLGDKTSQAKNISIAEQTVILIAQVTYGELAVEIALLVYPPNGSYRCLPQGLRVEVFNENWNLFDGLNILIEDEEPWIRLDFSLNLGERFIVRLSLEEESIVEGFEA